MKLTEIKTLREAEADLNFSLDEPQKEPAAAEQDQAPEKKPTEKKQPKVAKPAAGAEEHKHPDDFKSQLLDLFKKADSAGDLQPYQKAEVVQVRPATEGEEIQVDYPGEFKKTKIAGKGEYVVRDTQDPTKMKLVTKQELDQEYSPDQADQQPDAEGYLKYTTNGQIVAFQYNEHEPMKLIDDNGRKITIKFGDYLGYNTNDASELIRMDKAHFEKEYRLAK